MRIADDLIPFLNSAPQPVAQALGRVVRLAGPAARLEACIKAAEVVARYVAVAGLASAAASADENAVPLKLEEFVGNLSFGSFEKAIRAAYGTSWNHPLREILRKCLRSTKKNKPLAGVHLESFVQLRNELGHALTTADDMRARLLFEERDPIGALIDLITGLEPILALPLVVALDQQQRRRMIQTRIAWYSGEAEPIPRTVVVNEGFFEWETPYLCTGDGLIPLSPGLLFQLQADGRLGPFLLDAISETGARYKSVYNNQVVETERTLSEIARWIELPFEVAATPNADPLFEVITSSDGRTLLSLIRNEIIVSPDGPPKGEVLTGDTKHADQRAPMLTVVDFERAAIAAGVGLAYRDILYFLLERGNRAELGGNGVRILSSSDNRRVLLSLSVSVQNELIVSIFSGAFSDERTDTIVETIKPNESADRVLILLAELTAREKERGI